MFFSFLKGSKPFKMTSLLRIFCSVFLVLASPGHCFAAPDSLGRFFAYSSTCTQTLSATATLTSTVYETCGYIPATALGVCSTSQARNLHPTHGGPIIEPTEVSRNTRDITDTPQDPIILDSGVPDQSGTAQSTVDDAAGSPRLFTNLLGGLQIPFSSVSCSSSHLSTSLTTATYTISSPYTCVNTNPVKLFPVYGKGDCGSASICASTTTIYTTSTTINTIGTCGTIPAGNLPQCAARRSAIDSTSVESAETTTKPEKIYQDRVPDIESSLPLPREENRVSRAGDCIPYTVTSRSTALISTTTIATSAYTCYNAQNAYSPSYDRSFCTAAEKDIPGSCTVFRDVTTGTFTSPNYPNNYPANANVCWVIIAPAGKTISLTFTDFFVEALVAINKVLIEDRVGYCALDSVTVYDGTSASTSSTTKTVCGGRGQSTFSSTSNYMYVVFKSNNNGVELSGFSANFKTV